MNEPDPSDGRSMMQRMRDGDLYHASDPEISEAARVAMEFAVTYNATGPADTEQRRTLLDQHLGTIGDDVEVRAPVRVDYGIHIHIGDRTFINVGLIALDVCDIRIGADVLIGPNVQLLTPTHPLDADLRRTKWEAGEPITIGDNVWLGGGVVVCPGVTIGENTVVGAGAVVTRDLPANVLAVGSPARVIRELG